MILEQKYVQIPIHVYCSKFVKRKNLNAFGAYKKLLDYLSNFVDTFQL